MSDQDLRALERAAISAPEDPARRLAYCQALVRAGRASEQWLAEGDVVQWNGRERDQLGPSRMRVVREGVYAVRTISPTKDVRSTDPGVCLSFYLDGRKTGEIFMEFQPFARVADVVLLHAVPTTYTEDRRRRGLLRSGKAAEAGLEIGDVVRAVRPFGHQPTLWGGTLGVVYAIEDEGRIDVAVYHHGQVIVERDAFELVHVPFSLPSEPPCRPWESGWGPVVSTRRISLKTWECRHESGIVHGKMNEVALGKNPHEAERAILRESGLWP